MNKDTNMNRINKNVFIFGICVVSILFVFLINIFLINVADAADCSVCHTDIGTPVKAKDTIEISSFTCLKCHDSDYAPTSMGYNTHLVHIGSYSVSVDYLKRHPDVAKSLSCDSCHIKIIDCRDCHIKGLPHIKPPIGDNCQGCHGTVDKLFRHPAINLQIHNLFNSNKSDCTICHNPENMRSLKLASDQIVPIQESHRLCYQCHSGSYNLWNNGSHYANKTIPKNRNIMMSPELLDNWNDKWRKDNTCTSCHNPHNPSELYQLPISNIGNTDVSILSTLSKLYLYIIGILLIIIAVILVVTVKYKIDLKNVIVTKLSKLSRSKLPESDVSEKSPIKPKSKWKLPKISIPISISVKELKEKEEEKEKATEKTDELDKKLEDLIDSADTKKGVSVKKRKSLKKRLGFTRNDVLFLIGLIITLGIFYIIFGNFIPIVVAISESMSPHMERGDMLFYTDISKIDSIKTYQEEKNKSRSGHVSFGMYGDVIMYKSFGKEGVTPYIHRAMYYVEEGQEMWPGGPKAPHAGYITKGDNSLTNKKYDQQLDLSLNQPVKKEWIMGVANFRIPYIGYIRLILPI